MPYGEAAPAPAPAKTSAKVRYSIGVRVLQLEQVTVTIPEILGYWKRKDVDLEVDSVGGSGEIFRLMAEGVLDVGYIGTDSLFFIRAQGAPLRLVYNTISKRGFYPIVLANSNIRDIQGLKRKVIGSQVAGSSGEITTRALAAEAGLDPQAEGREVRPDHRRADEEAVGLPDRARQLKATPQTGGRFHRPVGRGQHLR